MDSERPLSIIIVNYNSGRLTLDSLDSIRRHASHLDHEVIVVDNASQDKSPDLIEAHYPEAHLLRMESNLGFGAANNRGAAVARAKYLLLLNNDAILLENSLTPLIETLQKDPSIGVIGPEIHYPDGRFQISSGPDATIFNEFVMKHLPFMQQRRIQNGPDQQSVDWISGAAMMIPAEIYRAVGGFDETFFLYMEDADLCRRIRSMGYRTVFNRTATIVHSLGETTSRVKNSLLPAIKRGHLHYYAKHNSRLSLLLLRAYLFLRYRWDKTLPPETHDSLMNIIRRTAK